MNTEILYPQNEALHLDERERVEVKLRVATRILFVDNLRIFLTILVILHHLMNIYAASGGWIYQEGRQDLITAMIGKWFTVVNQSYFMGLFMLISAYFVPGSYDRKGYWRFVKDRLVRLGIPLFAYSLIIRPLLVYAALSGFGEVHRSFFDWLFRLYFKDYNIIGGGPLWFISALLIFSILYALIRHLIPARLGKPVEETSFPCNGIISIFAILVALVSFLVRLWYPSDRVFIPLGFQFADFPLYIALFIVGLVAYRRNWLIKMPGKTGRFWMRIALFLALLWPPMVMFLGALENSAPFQGGWHWQSVIAASWQTFLGISMCITMIYIFKNRFDQQRTLARFLSHNAYTAYLIHEAIITLVAVSVMGVMLYPLLKFGVMALVTIPLIFGLSSIVRKLPLTEHIL